MEMGEGSISGDIPRSPWRDAKDPQAIIRLSVT